MKTFFVNNFDINNITICGDEHNHLKNVMRLNVGDRVRVVNNTDFDYFCEIEQINKSNTILKLIDQQLNNCNPKTKLTAFVALIKNDNLSLIIQKLTELGVSQIVPFESRYTVIKDKGSKTEKLQAISNQSIKQCGRSIAAKVLDTHSVKQMCASFKNFDLVVFANETENNKDLNEILSLNKSAKNIAIIVGPEGGFCESEIDQIKTAGAKSVGLGSRILRAETACIFLTSIVLNFYGEYN